MTTPIKLHAIVNSPTFLASLLNTSSLATSMLDLVINPSSTVPSSLSANNTCNAIICSYYCLI